MPCSPRSTSVHRARSGGAAEVADRVGHVHRGRNSSERGGWVWRLRNNNQLSNGRENGHFAREVLGQAGLCPHSVRAGLEGAPAGPTDAWHGRGWPPAPLIQRLAGAARSVLHVPADLVIRSALERAAFLIHQLLLCHPCALFCGSAMKAFDQCFCYSHHDVVANALI
jgi:hypothetical protein